MIPDVNPMRPTASHSVDLVIINPAAAHGIYGSELAQSLIAVEPPLWCRLIAGYVRKNGGSVRIIDAEAENLTPTAVAIQAWAYRPRLVCLAVYGHQPSASTQQMYGARAVAKALRSVCPAPVIMVGGHPSALPATTLTEEPVDYVCRGEGPLAILKLLQNEEIGKIPGLVYRGLDEVVTNPRAPLLKLEDLEYSVWQDLPMERYRSHNWQCFDNMKKRQPYASIFTSLGCSFKCSFCCINAPFGTNQYRMRHPSNVVAEIMHLYERYGVRTFKIVDEMFILNKRHYSAICEGLIGSGIADDINIWAYARVDTVKPDTLAMLRRAGFKWLALGIESGSAYVRDGAEKALKTDDIKGIVAAIRAANINVIANYIFGLPDDNLETMHETLDLALDLNTEFANFYSAMAYPGSPLYDTAVQNNWKLPDSWRGYSQHNSDCTPLATKYVDGSTVLRFRDNAFDTYFTNPRYLDLIGGKFGDETLQHIKGMTTYKLQRRLLEAA